MFKSVVQGFKEPSFETAAMCQHFFVLDAVYHNASSSTQLFVQLLKHIFHFNVGFDNADLPAVEVNYVSVSTTPEKE